MRKTAFTLVELLIVIMIIGILATMAVPQYNKMVEKAKWAEVIQMYDVIKRADIVYKQAYGSYAGGGGTILNGPLAVNVGLGIDIPPSKADGRFIYMLFDPVFMTGVGWGNLILNVGYSDSSGNGYDMNKPYAWIYFDGTNTTTTSYNGAPKLNL